MTSCNVGFGFLLLVDVPNILFMNADFDLARLWRLRNRTGWLPVQQHKAAAHAASAEGHAYRDSSDEPQQIRSKFKKLNSCFLDVSLFLPSTNEVQPVITDFFLNRIAHRHRLFRSARALT